MGQAKAGTTNLLPTFVPLTPEALRVAVRSRHLKN